MSGGNVVLGPIGLAIVVQPFMGTRPILAGGDIAMGAAAARLPPSRTFHAELHGVLHKF